MVWIISLLGTNAVIAVIAGAFAVYLVKWLATERGDQFKAYEGWAIALIKGAAKLLPDGSPLTGVQKADFVCQKFVEKYEKAVGRKVGEQECALIEAWISEVHEALVDAGTLRKAAGNGQG